MLSVWGGGREGELVCVFVCTCVYACLFSERGGVSVRYRLGQKLVKGRVDN